MATPVLTDAEREVIALLGRAAGLFSREVLGQGVTREADLAEFVAFIHVLQHTVMAQAAARCFPTVYRLVGE